MSEKQVCVITGGSSGMGLAAARRMAKRGFRLVLAARGRERLETAAAELAAQGADVTVCPCDISDRQSVDALAAFAAQQGDVTTVLHIAGMSPHMGDAEKIMRGNALGTVYIHNAFYPVLHEGGVLVDTSSMSAYLAPEWIMPKRAFRFAAADENRFFRKMMARVRLVPQSARAGMAYAVSKYFVIRYVRSEAARFGKKGVRIVCITPGNFDTPMGALEAGEAGTYLKFNALPRSEKPDEIAALYEAVSDPAMGYLTGTDILCDGGCVAGGAGPFSR